jgi:hypothetical protein
MTSPDFPGIAPGVSRTAFTAAAVRAAHLPVDAAPPDLHAAPSPRHRAEELLAYHRLHDTYPVLVGARAEAVCCGRFTEERLLRANSGIYQYQIL